MRHSEAGWFFRSSRARYVSGEGTSRTIAESLVTRNPPRKEVCADLYVPSGPSGHLPGKRGGQTTSGPSGHLPGKRGGRNPNHPPALRATSPASGEGETTANPSATSPAGGEDDCIFERHQL